MKKNMLLPATGVLAIVLATTSPAFADTFTTEVRNVDFEGESDGIEFVGEYTHRGYILRSGVEATYLTGENISDSVTVAPNIAVEIQAPAGVVISPQAELGYTLQSDGEDGAFWGVEMGAYRDFGTLTAMVALRHREGIDAPFLDETRISSGVRLNLNNNHSFGLNYFLADANIDYSAIGVSYRAAF